MDNISGTTKVNGIAYPYTVQQFESLDEVTETMGEEAAVANLNGLQDQNAKQGPKSGPREAIEAAEEAGYSTEQIQDAVDTYVGTGDLPAEEELAAVVSEIEDAQETTAGYVLGQPRGRTDGVTKTKAREIGEKLRETMSEEELREMANELGVEV